MKYFLLTIMLCLATFRGFSQTSLDSNAVFFYQPNLSFEMPTIDAYNVEEGDFTIEFTLSRHGDISPEKQTIFSNRDSDSDSARGIELSFFNRETRITFGDRTFAHLTFNSVPERCYHFMVTRTGNSIFWYNENGIIEGYFLKNENQRMDSQAPITIGYNAHSPEDTRLNASMNLLRIWDRHLDYEEFSKYLFVELNPKTPGLVGAWTFSNTETINDQTNLGNNITTNLDSNVAFYEPMCTITSCDSLVRMEPDTSHFFLCPDEELTLTARGDSTYSWIYYGDTLSIDELTIKNDSLLVTVLGNTCQYSDSISLSVLPLTTCSPVSVYEAVTDNGDGKNDFWEISNLDSYPSHRVRLFDLYSNLVFETNDFNNTWNAQNLPSGTYFYEVSIQDISFHKTGTLIISH